MSNNKPAYEIRTASGRVLGPWESHYGEITDSNLLVWLNKHNRRLGAKNRLLERVEVIKVNIGRCVAYIAPNYPNKTNFVKVIVTGTHVNTRLFIKETEVYKTLQVISDIHGNFSKGEASLSVDMRKVRIDSPKARKLSAILDTIKQAGLKKLEQCKALVKQAA